MIAKISNITLAKDGGLERISAMYDEIDEDGKTISVNNRISRIVTDDLILDSIANIENYVDTIIEEG